MYRLHNAAELETCHTVSANVITQWRRINFVRLSDILNCEGGRKWRDGTTLNIMRKKKSEMQALQPHDLFIPLWKL